MGGITEKIYLESNWKEWIGLMSGQNDKEKDWEEWLGKVTWLGRIIAKSDWNENRNDLEKMIRDDV